MIRTLWRILLLLWLTSVLFVISLPWAKFDGTLHWDNIHWIPLAYLSFHPSDVFETAANFLVFIPIGYLMVRSLPPGTSRPLWFAFLLGLSCSTGMEFYQLLCHDRVSSTTDVFTNVTGTVLGAYLALGIDQFLNLCTVRLSRLSS